MSLLLLLPALAIASAARAQTIDSDSYLRQVFAAAPEASSAEQAYKAADAQWRQAISDAWLPAFNASANGNPWGYNPLNSNRWNSLRLNADDITYSFGMSLNLFNSFYDRRRIDQARLTREASLAALDQVRQTLAIGALTAYLDLYLKQKLKEVASVDLEAQKGQYDLTHDLYRHGMKSKSDLLKSETDWRSSELREFGAENERKKALYHFNLLAARPADAEAQLPDLTAGSTRFLDLSEALARAERDRPELRKSALDVKNSELSAQNALQNFFPKLSAAFNWNETRSASFGNAGAPSTAQPYYYLGLTLSLPVGYNGASQYEAHEAAKASARQAAFDRAALLRGVRENVYFAKLDLDQTFESYRVGALRERIAKDNLDIVLEQYRLGSADVIRLAQARADYLQAQTDRLTFLHDTQLRWLSFKQAIGEPLWAQ